MKRYCALLLFLLLCNAVAAQASWEAYVIDQHLAVRFPAQPQEINLPQTLAATTSPQQEDSTAAATRAFHAEDGLAHYVVLSIPYKDSLYFARPIAEREAYCKEHSIPLMMQQAHAELLDQAFSFKPGADGFTVKFRSMRADGTSGIKYLRMLTIEKQIYQLYFTPKTEEDGRNEREQFFAVLYQP